MSGMRKPILCLDFDGVLHSYGSGWQGARNIPDPPVAGALKFLVTAMQSFQVAIYSSRSHQFGGRRAMKRWLKKHLIAAAGNDFSDTPEWWREEISKVAFADPWPDEVEWAASNVIKAISWPSHKPSAMISIDDRALTFDGTWPDLSTLKDFKPWNKR